MTTPPSNPLQRPPPPHPHPHHHTSHAHPWQCTIYKTLADNKDVWAYDKRFHTSLEESLKVPPIPMPPPFQAGGGRGPAGRLWGGDVDRGQCAVLSGGGAPAAQGLPTWQARVFAGTAPPQTFVSWPSVCAGKRALPPGCLCNGQGMHPLRWQPARCLSCAPARLCSNAGCNQPRPEARSDCLQRMALSCCLTLQEGKWKFIEGKPVNKEVHAAIEQMIGQMNAGIAMLQPIAQARR